MPPRPRRNNHDMSLCGEKEGCVYVAAGYFEMEKALGEGQPALALLLCWRRTEHVGAHDRWPVFKFPLYISVQTCSALL
eukprot:6215294-Amphidinium_carterae.1